MSYSPSEEAEMRSWVDVRGWVLRVMCVLAAMCALAVLSCGDDAEDESKETGETVECGSGTLVGSSCAEDCTAGSEQGKCPDECWEKSGQEFCDCMVACCKSVGCGPPKFQ